MHYLTKNISSFLSITFIQYNEDILPTIALSNFSLETISSFKLEPHSSGYYFFINHYQKTLILMTLSTYSLSYGVPSRPMNLLMFFWQHKATMLNKWLSVSFFLFKNRKIRDKLSYIHKLWPGVQKFGLLRKIWVMIYQIIYFHKTVNTKACSTCPTLVPWSQGPNFLHMR